MSTGQKEQPRVGVAAGWGGPIVAWIEALKAPAARADAAWMAAAEQAIDAVPGLLRELDIGALADAIEAGLGAATVVGAAEGLVSGGRGAQDEPRTLMAVEHWQHWFAADPDPVSMPGVVVAPLAEAVAALDRRTPIAAKLGSAEWAAMPVALRQKAQFSAHVGSVRVLSEIQDQARKRLALEREKLANGKAAFVDRDSFIQHMRGVVEAEGIDTTGGDATARGGIRDIRSAKRLGLIYDIQTGQAAEYARWKMGQDADVLDEFPAWRFVRVSQVEKPRDWHKQFEGTVRLKTDLEFWTRVNDDFGVPWGPWGWGCGHDVEDVDREEAERLGLVTPGERLEPAERALNDRLEASLEDVDAEMREWLEEQFGEQIEIRGDTIRWKGDGGDGRTEDGKTDGGNLLRGIVREEPVGRPGVSENATIHGLPPATTEAAREALRAADRAHAGGGVPGFAVTAHKGPDMGGYNARTATVGVRADSPWPRVTTLHELGHHEDFTRLGEPGQYGSMTSGDFAGWWAAVEKSPTFRRMRKLLGNEPEQQYWLDPKELFARSYAQYVAYRSGDVELLRDLAKALRGNPSWRQWKATEFAPIGQALDELLRQRGLV